MARKLSRSEKLDLCIHAYFELFKEIALRVHEEGDSLFLSSRPIVRMSSGGIYHELCVRCVRVNKDAQLELSEDGVDWVEYNTSISAISLISIVSLYKAVFNMS